MLFVTGEIRSIELVKVLQRFGWGRMFIENKPSPYPGERWGFDNGAYRDFVRNRCFDEKGFMRRFERAYKEPLKPFMAVIPDIVAGGMASFDYSASWLNRLPADWPWYLAVQNGMEVEAVKSLLPTVAGIFLGGDEEFKGSTGHEWSSIAKQYGKMYHYARCGTGRKIRHAYCIGADSVDSVAPIWIPRCQSLIARAMESGNVQQPLSLFG
jgi:hypothetical protein